MPIHRTLISTLFFIHIYKGSFFCPHGLILSLFSPQPGIRRALKTWTWIQCVCAFSASSSGRTAGKTISARWCRSPFMTRVRHNQTNTPKSLDRSQPSAPKIRQRTSLFSRFVVHVFFKFQRQQLHHSWRSPIWTCMKVPALARRRSTCCVTKCRKVTGKFFEVRFQE